MKTSLLEIFFIALLIILNGIFSAGEMAIVSSRKSKIKEILKQKKEKKAQLLLEMKENPERFFSAVQIGITIFGTLASAMGGILAMNRVKPLISGIPYIGAFDETISLVIVVTIMTYLFLVFGELIPKYIGISYKEKIAILIVPLFEFISKVFSVFVNILSVSSMFFVKGLNLKNTEEHVSEGEIKILLEEGRRKGVFDVTEEELIHGVFEFADRSAKEVMVPWPNIYGIRAEDPADEVLQYAIENQFSRYPVYRNNLDNVVGIAYLKDITKQIWLKEPLDLDKIMKKPYFVPDTMKIRALLKEMQKRRQHMAVVVDEYGTTAGIITLEDIVEEIFGEIMDETDVEEGIEKMKDGSLLIDGAYSIRDLNHRLGIDLPESTDYETLGGFILTRIKSMAKGGEVVRHKGCRFTVVDVEGIRISSVKFEILRKKNGE